MKMYHSDDITVDDILRENSRRKAVVHTPYDPLAGDPADPFRFHFLIDDYEAWLPREMEGEQLVLDLLRAGSIRGYMAAVKGSVDDELRAAVMDELCRLRCRYDFEYWAATFAYIKRKGGGEDILFTATRPQRKLIAALEGMRRRERPIRLILLKARQWGGSTCIQIYMIWLQLMHGEGLNSLIIAHQGACTDEIKDMFDRLMAAYPVSMLHPRGEEYSERERKVERVGGAGAAFRIVARNCKLKVGTAERPNSCRGGDYNLVHLSEVGLWRATRLKMPEDIQRSACSGVLLKPLTMIVMESTANGTGNFFHREYEAAKSGESQFEALFVAWYEIEQYSLPFSGDGERDFARRLIEGRGARHAVNERRQPGAYLWWLWEKGASLEAIHWYVAERSKYSDHGLMAAEYPSDDVEAFVHSGARVFDKYKVEELRRGCRAPAMRGEISGDAPSGQRSLRNVHFTPHESGALAVWKDRDPAGDVRVEGRYLAVVDIGGRSRSADWSVIAVFDRRPDSGSPYPEVVAQWRGHTDFDLLAWNAARIATYYDNALLVIESNTLETRDPNRSADGGQSSYLLNQIRDAYPNLYARRQSEEDIRQGVPTRYGFHTNTATKPMIVSTLVMAVREGLYTERDEECLSEYLTYEQRQDGSYGALPGRHDDLLMTRAIGLHISMQEMDPPRVRMKASSPWHGDRPASPAIF